MTDKLTGGLTPENCKLLEVLMEWRHARIVCIKCLQNVNNKCGDLVTRLANAEHALMDATKFMGDGDAC